MDPIFWRFVRPIVRQLAVILFFCRFLVQLFKRIKNEQRHKTAVRLVGFIRYGYLKSMIVHRWQAPLIPDIKTLRRLFVSEGLDPIEEQIAPGDELSNLREPLTEVRMVVEGELHMDIMGNKLLLRAGDKIVIPANTRYAVKPGGNASCVSIKAYKI